MTINGKPERDPSVATPRRELLASLRYVREQMLAEGYESSENLRREAELVRQLKRQK